MLIPEEIVAELDKHIIGQCDGKRAVAIALRNRWRRSQIGGELEQEIKPKNILMIGPTGVGKTEIAKRLSAITMAPFIKVEATKFTEVGYVGRDVESIIRDLVEIAVKATHEQEFAKVRESAWNSAMERVLDVLIGDTVPVEETTGSDTNILAESVVVTEPRALLRAQLAAGELDDKVIEIEIALSPIGVEIMAPPGMEEMTGQLQSMFSNLSGERLKKRKMQIKHALKYLCDEEADALMNNDEIRSIALENVEQQGIVFLDEIDKITQRGSANGADISREGVQRDLLPLVEGCSVSTKYGVVKTDHILFIASGAFHFSKPADLIPELQGRFPIRVELNALSASDFVRILTEPKASLVEQYVALLAVEGVEISFSEDGLHRIAEIAYQVNERVENIGARRLYTIMEKLLEEISFTAPKRVGEHIIIDVVYVDTRLADLIKNEDLTKYIL